MRETLSSLPANRIGAALLQGELHEAERMTREWLAMAPRDTDGLILLGLCLQQQGRLDQAAQTYRVLTELAPSDAMHWNNLGATLRLAGAGEAAEAAYREALQRDPHAFDALMGLGYLLLDRDEYAQAMPYFLAAHAVDPDSPEARIFAARMRLTLDRRDLALELLEPWREWTDLNDALWLELAILLTHLGPADGGARIFDHLLARNPHNLRVIAHRVLVLERMNRLDEARAMLARLPAAQTLDDAPLRADITAAQIALALRDQDPAPARALLERAIAEQQPARDQAGRRTRQPEHAQDLYFGLAKACDRQGDVDAAMAALREVHAQQIERARKAVPHLLEPDAPPLPGATHWISAEAHAAWPELAAPATQASPIFIVGFPRSGTTMLEQMLDAHPALQAMDEQAFLHAVIERMATFGCAYPFDLGKLDGAQCDALRAVYLGLAAKVAPRREGQRLVDKNPLNILRLPLIHRLFPNAPIILALRHPCDVILSNYMQQFRANSFAVLCSSLERLTRGYVTAMEFWRHHANLFKPRVLTSRYEDLLEDFAGNVARIGAFLELDDATPLKRFDQHARAKGFISTPSYAQVVVPPNHNAVNRWRRYRHYFEPLLPSLRPLIQHWGYAE